MVNGDCIIGAWLDTNVSAELIHNDCFPGMNLDSVHARDVVRIDQFRRLSSNRESRLVEDGPGRHAEREPEVALIEFNRVKENVVEGIVCVAFNVNMSTA